MMSEVPVDRNAQTEMASEIVAAYVRHNSVPVAEVSSLIRSVYDTLTNLRSPETPEVSAEPLKPAVSIKKSVTDEFIISLEDGRKFKSMKRYLAGLGMTPADYRAKWGLPSDYPMVAPAYAARRSELAKTIGLGRKGAGAAPKPVEELASPPEPQVDAPASKRGGRKKVA